MTRLAERLFHAFKNRDHQSDVDSSRSAEFIGINTSFASALSDGG